MTQTARSQPPRMFAERPDGPTDGECAEAPGAAMAAGATRSAEPEGVAGDSLRVELIALAAAARQAPPDKAAAIFSEAIGLVPDMVDQIVAERLEARADAEHIGRLPELQQRILTGCLDLWAVNAAARRTHAEIAAHLRVDPSRAFTSACRQMVTMGLLDSHTGRTGGVWLRPIGSRFAKKIKHHQTSGDVSD